MKSGGRVCEGLVGAVRELFVLDGWGVDVCLTSISNKCSPTL